MILPRRLLSPLFAGMVLVGLAACDPVSLTIGAGATVGSVAYQERGIKGVARDTALEARVFKLWFDANKNLSAGMSIEVYESRVLLTGVARSEEERAEAVGLAWKADGVADVINEVVIGDPSSLGDLARDSAITAELKSKLTFDDKVMAVNYTIETSRGVVFLLVLAQDQAELDRVIARARDVSYVKRVVSYVRVKTPQGGDGG